MSKRPHGIGDRKTRFGTAWRNPRDHFPQNFAVRVRAAVPNLYSRLHPNPFRFGGYNRKTLPQSPKWIYYNLLQAYKYIITQKSSDVQDSKSALTVENCFYNCSIFRTENEKFKTYFVYRYYHGTEYWGKPCIIRTYIHNKFIVLHFLKLSIKHGNHGSACTPCFKKVI